MKITNLFRSIRMISLHSAERLKEVEWVNKNICENYEFLYLAGCIISLLYPT
jgi:hypothetical protein